MAVMTRSQYEDFTHLRRGYLTVDEATLAGLRQTAYPAGTPGEMTYDESATGYRDEIGIAALAGQLWAISRDARARTYMLLNADCSKYFPIHRYVTGQSNDGPPKPWVYGTTEPGFTLDTTNYPNQNTSINVEMAHKPQFLFDACVLMFQEANAAKSSEYLLEMKYHVSWNFFNSPKSARNGVAGIFNPHASANQPRGTAWGFRDLLMLMFVLQNYAPADPWLPWVKSSVEENVKYFNGCYNLGNYNTDAFNPYYNFPVGAFKNNLGITQGANFAYASQANNVPAVIAPWMQAFQGSVFIWGQLLGLTLSTDVAAQYVQLATFMSKFVVGLVGAPNDATAYDYRRCGQYNMIIGTTLATGDVQSGLNYCANFADLFAANKGVEFPATTLANPDDYILRDSSNDNVSGFTTRYDDNLGPHLAMAVDFGAYGANESFNRWWRTQAKPGGSIPFNYLPNTYRSGQDHADLPASTGPAPTPVPPTAPPPVTPPPVTPPPVTPPPVTPPPTGLPAWVPPKPTTANSYYLSELPLTNSEDSVMTIAGLTSLRTDPYTTYAGSAPYDSVNRKFVLASSGHHPGGSNFTPSYVLTLGASGGTWSLMNQPPASVVFPDVAPPDAVTGYPNFYTSNGLYQAGYAFVPHTYAAAVILPGALSAGGIPRLWYRGIYNNWIKRDYSYATGGDTVAVTTFDPGSHPGDEVSAAVWNGVTGTVGGIFAVYCQGNQAHTPLLRGDGTVDNTTYPQTNGEYLSTSLAIDNTRNILYGVNKDGALRVVDLITKQAYDNSYAAVPSDPKRWVFKYDSSRDAILGINPFRASPNADDIVALIPPSAGDRRSSTWQTAYLTGALWSGAPSGSQTSLRLPQDQSNSAWAGWDYIPEWDCYARFTTYGTRPQLIRFSDNIGPSPTSPPVTLPPVTPPSVTPPPVTAPPTSTILRIFRSMLRAGTTARIFDHATVATTAPTPGTPPSPPSTLPPPDITSLPIIPGIPASPTTSGTVGLTQYNALSVIEEAFRRAGKIVSTVSSEQLLAAKQNLYNLLTQLSTKGLNLWCTSRFMVGFNPNRTTYDLPLGTVDVKNVQLRRMRRIVPDFISNSDNSNTNAYFDEDVTRSLPQLSANGYVRAAFNVTTKIDTIGYVAGASQQSKLLFSTSDDGQQFITRQIIERTTVAGKWEWFDLDQGFNPALYYQLQEVDGATINFGELYFGRVQTEIDVTSTDRDSYAMLSNKTYNGDPSQYWYDKQVSLPKLNLWPTPRDFVNQCLVIMAQRQIQDVGDLTNTVEVPQRWYEAVVSLLAARIAMGLPKAEKDLNLIQYLQSYGDDQTRIAQQGESDGSPVRLLPNIRRYTGRRY